MRTVRARFRVVSAISQGLTPGIVDQETVIMNPVYSQDPNDENHTFWKATPSGELKLTITNPNAIGLLVIGHEFYLDLVPTG